MNKNSFINQFSENIKFHYTSFDRVIIRGYILNFFSVACVVRFLKAMGFSRKTNGVAPFFRILGIVQVKIKVNSKYLTPLLPFIIDIPERFTYHIFICATVSHKHKKRRLSWPDHYPVSQPVWMQTPKAF